MQFNPDTNVSRIFSTARDNTLRIWDPDDVEANELLQITGSSKLIYATWGPKGHRILTCWKDGVVRLHETLPWEELAQVGDDFSDMTDRIRRWREKR
ncbi:MAG TPA: hypothetical protein EYQ50_20360 [Verrucomicrobiales bacterium]|nr:hypothetical protein [Verrucomicrobiales bacterium]